jgi:hypothetical protein
MEVLGSMFSRRGITAAHMAAGETEPKVDPPGSGLQAFLTPIRGVRPYWTYLIEVYALHLGHSLPSRSSARRSQPPSSAPASYVD